jgi:hypothetical protein
MVAKSKKIKLQPIIAQELASPTSKMAKDKRILHIS